MQVLLVTCIGRRVPQMMKKHLGHTASAVRPTNPHAVGELFERMFAEAKRGEPLAREIVEATFPLLLLTIERGLVAAEQSASRSRALYLECRRFIDRNFARMTCVGEAAKACGISHEYMCRLFAKYDKASPHTYFVRLRMNYAAHLLSTSDATLGVMAEQLGFSDAYAFSKSFKRMMGVAPGTYRRASGLPGGR